MTYPPQQPYEPPVVSGTHGYNPHPPAGDWTPPAPKSRVLPVLLGILALAVLGVAGLVMAATLGGNPAQPTAAQPAAEGAAVAPAEPVADAPKAPRAPKAAEFALVPKITDKQCFGSAGCNVDLEVKVTYVGPTLSEDDTWQITYELTGDESGPIIGSFELTGETYEVNTESLSTRSSKTKITVKVTDVEKVGI